LRHRRDVRAAPRTSTTGRAISGSGLVAIVDDDADLRQALADVLQDEGYTCIEARDGREALDLLRRASPKPDVILLDLMMPMMDGWQLQIRLRDDPDLATIPIVVMTAHAGFLRAAASIRPGTAVLPKPIDLPRLLEVVATHSRLKRLGAH